MLLLAVNIIPERGNKQQFLRYFCSFLKLLKLHAKGVWALRPHQIED